jgi:hypothetical protein
MENISTTNVERSSTMSVQPYLYGLANSDGMKVIRFFKVIGFLGGSSGSSVL